MGSAPSPEAVDGRWMTQALRRAGVLGEVSVVNVEATRVGAGMLGDSVRFALTYDDEPGDAPVSVVGKFASADPVSRATGASYGLYLKEVRFYQEIADAVAIRTPRAYVAEIDETTSAFVLLMEDLTPARAGDQLSGCPLADAETVIDQAAGLHGPLWGDPRLSEYGWLASSDPEAGAAHVAAFPEFLRLFRERYDDMLEPEVMRVCIEAVEHVTSYYGAPRTTPATVQHLDFRLDNMLFEARGGADRLAVLDWQSVTAGPGVLDVTYFIGAGLPTALRREHERALLDRWLERLGAYGVTGYDREAAWRDYRLHAMQGLYTAVFASVATKRTERGDHMFLTMARRHARQVEDLETLILLQRLA